MYQVLFLDDEIMAVEYLAEVIEWEEYGFQIACAETSPTRALEFIRKNRVDIAFVDIRMPGIDGLEFAKKALEIFPRLKIIIVSSYDDFGYAKEAISLGVWEYMLKHNLKTDTLLDCLQKIGYELDKEKSDRRIVAVSLLRKIINHGDVLGESEKQKLHQYIYFKKRHMICFWVELDKSLIERKESFGFAGGNERGLAEFIELLGEKDAITINLEPGKWLVLEAFELVASQKRIQEESFRIACQIQRFVYNNYKGKTVSIIPSPVFNDVLEMRNIYIMLREYSQFLIFYERNKVLDIRELAHRKRVGEAKLQETLDNIYRCFEEGDKDKALQELDRILGACISAKDANAVRIFDKEMMRFIEKYIKRYDLSRSEYESVLTNGMIYSVQALHANLAELFEGLIKEKKEKEYSHISEKIRRGVKYIHNHYNEDIRLEDVARHMGISGEYLRHLFKTEMGDGFSEYLTKLRIEEAKKLLREKDLKLYEIADKVGYKSGTYFSSIFKKVTGVKPLDYKARIEDEKKRD